ncbi:hypothetical protein [Lysobacter arvi]|uniref:Uncharacterized protein n=1 Tax=Lysobacter arvi TaxID=3038776 RepID=A0ABU1CIB1_9GAMM|nr:hypothetical protein [Lysobacter arvi]MDR0184687.1 hypothetical protein [Lysobacter arvi]
MKTMTLMAALAMLAATHSIATRTAAASDATTTAAPAIRTFDLPTVRVHATVERASHDEHALALQPPRIHDLPPVRVHAARDERDVADLRRPAIAMRAAVARRASLAIPRGSSRRGIAAERVTTVQADERVDRWIALGCALRQRLDRVWPMRPCNDGAAVTRAGAGVAMPVAAFERRR